MWQETRLKPFEMLKKPDADCLCRWHRPTDLPGFDVRHRAADGLEVELEEFGPEIEDLGPGLGAVIAEIQEVQVQLDFGLIVLVHKDPEDLGPVELTISDELGGDQIADRHVLVQGVEILVDLLLVVGGHLLGEFVQLHAPGPNFLDVKSARILDGGHEDAHGLEGGGRVEGFVAGRRGVGPELGGGAVALVVLRGQE